MDTFFTEAPCVLKIKMQKSTAAAPNDLTFQKIDFYMANGMFIQKQYFKGQKGMTNHTVEIPYSINLANQAKIEFRYSNGWPPYTTIINLEPTGTTNLTISY